MEIKIGGQKATAVQLEALRAALSVPSEAELSKLTPTMRAGYAEVTIGGLKYALLPLQANGGVKAALGHRTGLLASLLAMAGFDGEVAVAKDRQSLVVFTGVEGQAYELRPIGRLNAAGDDSLTLGHNASTASTAVKAVAVGPNAHANTHSEVVLGSGIDGVQRRLITLAGRTTSALDFPSLSTDNLAGEAPNAVKLAREGLYDIDVIVIARQIGTNNNARFHRRLTLRVGATGTPVKLYETAPTPDVATSLAVAAPTLMGVSGMGFAVLAEGVDGMTVQWAAFLDIREMSITV